jgi:hypothetical protein
MVAKNLSPPQGGMEGTPHHKGYSSNVSIFMCDQMVNLQMRAKNYDIPETSHVTPKATSSSQRGGPLHIEKPFLMHHFTPQRMFFNT